MFERYTEKARRVVFFARYEANEYGRQYIQSEHFLLALLREHEALNKRLRESPFPPESIRKQIEAETQPCGNPCTDANPPLSDEGKRILAYTAQGADRLGEYHISMEHLLFGVVMEKSGLGAKILAKAGIKKSEFRGMFGRTRMPYWAKTKLEDYVQVRGNLWSNSSIREVAKFCQRFHWEKRQWVPRDALCLKPHGSLHLYTGQPIDPEEAELVKGGWSYDYCATCWREFSKADHPGHDEGYTNGQDWLCERCFQIFVSPSHQE